LAYFTFSLGAPYRQLEVLVREKTIRTGEGAVSVQLRIREAELADTVRSYVDRKLQAGLQRFAGRLRNVQVTLQDVNGPRGGVDKSCRIAAEVFPSRRWVRQEARNANQFAAIALAVKGVKQAVRRVLERTRVWRVRRETIRKGSVSPEGEQEVRKTVGAVIRRGLESRKGES
jgi:putative sigma-54 modulation protein